MVETKIGKYVVRHTAEDIDKLVRDLEGKISTALLALLNKFSGQAKMVYVAHFNIERLYDEKKALVKAEQAKTGKHSIYRAYFEREANGLNEAINKLAELAEINDVAVDNAIALAKSELDAR